MQQELFECSLYGTVNESKEKLEFRLEKLSFNCIEFKEKNEIYQMETTDKEYNKVQKTNLNLVETTESSNSSKCLLFVGQPDNNKSRKTIVRQFIKSEFYSNPNQIKGLLELLSAKFKFEYEMQGKEYLQADNSKVRVFKIVAANSSFEDLVFVKVVGYCSAEEINQVELNLINLSNLLSDIVSLQKPESSNFNP